MKKWPLIRSRRGDRGLRWNPKWTTRKRLKSSLRWLVIRCLPRLSEHHSPESVWQRLISDASPSFSLLQSSFACSKHFSVAGFQWNSINLRSYLYLFSCFSRRCDSINAYGHGSWLCSFSVSVSADEACKEFFISFTGAAVGGGLGVGPSRFELDRCRLSRSDVCGLITKWSSGSV